MVNILTQKAVLADLSISCWGARVFDREVADEVLTKNGAQRDAGLFTKRLLRKGALRRIHSIGNAAKAYHEKHALPWATQRIRVLPVTLYPAYKARMHELRNEFYQAVPEFVEQYPMLIEEARQGELGSLFDLSDYPPAHKIADRFAMRVAIMPCQDDGDFRCELADGEMDEVRRNFRELAEAQYRKTLTDTAERIAEVVGRMSERLKAYKPGDKARKVKAEHTFQDSLVAHVRDLAALIPAFNLGGDPKLARLHEQITRKLCRYDAADLRESDGIRIKVAQDADKIVDAVKEFMS